MRQLILNSDFTFDKVNYCKSNFYKHTLKRSYK